MFKPTKIHTFSLPKFHIFSLPNTKTISWPRPAQTIVAKTTRKSFNSYTITVPNRIQFIWLGTKEGVQLTFTSNQGNIQILIPARFCCTVQNQIINMRLTDPYLKTEFKTLIGAIYRAMLGVTRGYREKLKTVGVGYKAGFTDDRLINMMLGYSHPVYYFLNPTTRIKFSRKFNRFNLQGPNTAIVNQSAADLYMLKQPDVYKGKGVRYRGYKLLKKEGKKKK